MQNSIDIFPALTSKYKSWKFLTRDLTGKNKYRKLGSLEQRHLEMGLSMPAGIARWIEFFRPELMQLDHLSILVAGVDWGAEVADDGRWYQLIPELLSRPKMTVSVSLVGPNSLVSSRADQINPNSIFNKPLKIDTLGALSGFPPAMFSEKSIGEFLVASESKFDLVVLPHPVFSISPGNWLSNEELGSVFDRNIPVAVFSYDILEQEMEEWILDHYGYRSLGNPLENPFNVALPGRTGDKRGIALALWAMSRGRLNEDIDRDVSTIDLYHNWVKNMVDSGHESSLLNSAAMVSFDESSSPGIFVPPNFVIDPVDKSVWLASSDLSSVEPTEIKICENILKAFDPAPQFQCDQYVWAMKAQFDIDQQILAAAI